MPELPDITVYIEAIGARVSGTKLIRATMRSPFLLRTADPPLNAVEGQTVRELRRIGKQIAIGFSNGLWIVIHLKIVGRLHWSPAALNRGGKTLLAIFEFDRGCLWMTEAGTQRRAAVYVMRGEAGLKTLDAAGMEPLETDLDNFAAGLRAANHTVKRALTDPHIVSGIGNSYSDEILHRARLSPIAMTQKLSGEKIERLYEATRTTLVEWTDRLRAEAEGEFPEKVTAFRSEMAVHGRYGKPCPRCGERIQRIRYARNETNYCAQCQTGGRLLADRAFSRLLREDWPRTLEQMEALKER